MPSDRFQGEPWPVVYSDCLHELLYWADQQGAEYDDVVAHTALTIAHAEYPVAEYLALGDKHSMEEYEALAWVSNDE